MDFVGQYLQATEDAEKAKRRQKAMAALQIDGGPIVTPAHDNFPGQVQANWAGNLAKLGLAYFGRKAEDTVAEKEKEATAARSGALTDIMSQTEASGKMNQDQMLALEQLGVDPAMIKLMQPKEPNLGAITQGAESLAGIEALLSQKKITPEDAERFRAALKQKEANERDRYKFEEQNQAFAPVQPRAESEIEFAQRDPEGYAKWLQQKSAATLASKPPVVPEYQKKIAQEQAKLDVAMTNDMPGLLEAKKTAEGLIKQYTDNPYTVGNKLRAADDFAETVGQKWKPSEYRQDVQMQLQVASDFRLEAMKRMRGFGQVTEAEQKIIENTQFSVYDGPEARMEKLNRINRAIDVGINKAQDAKKRMAAGTYMLPETSSDGWSIE